MNKILKIFDKYSFCIWAIVILLVAAVALIPFIPGSLSFFGLRIPITPVLVIMPMLMGILYAFILAMEAVSTNLVGKIIILASLLNFIVFFITSRGKIHYSPKQVKRRQEFRRETRRAAAVTKHKCAICGQTEEDNPDLEFRFCSKCNGNYEYCQNHLFTHEHVK